MLSNKLITLVIAVVILFIPFLCKDSAIYYFVMEKFGVHKRDIVIDRVEETKDVLPATRKVFMSAREKLASLTGVQMTDLERKYKILREEYRFCKKSGEKITEEIKEIKKASEALFREWQEELELYHDKRMQAFSREQLYRTKECYQEMLDCMYTAESCMQTVLKTLQDRILLCKHNLNARTIGSLESKVADIQNKISHLIREMDTAIEKTDTFLAEMEKV